MIVGHEGHLGTDIGGRGVTSVAGFRVGGFPSGCILAGSAHEDFRRGAAVVGRAGAGAPWRGAGAGAAAGGHHRRGRAGRQPEPWPAAARRIPQQPFERLGRRRGRTGCARSRSGPREGRCAQWLCPGGAGRGRTTAARHGGAARLGDHDDRQRTSLRGALARHRAAGSRRLHRPHHGQHPGPHGRVAGHQESAGHQSHGLRLPAQVAPAGRLGPGVERDVARRRAAGLGGQTPVARRRRRRCRRHGDHRSRRRAEGRRPAAVRRKSKAARSPS